MHVFGMRWGHNAHICAGTNQDAETSLAVGISKRSAALVTSLMPEAGRDTERQRQMELQP